LSTLKKLASQTAVYGISTILGRFLNYLLVPLHTRIFNLSEYGTITEMYAYVSFFMVLLTYGMETAYFRFSQKYDDNPRIFSTALISLLATSLIFISAAGLFAQPLANLIKYPNHSEYIIYFALILSLDAFTSICFAKLRQNNKAAKFAIVKTLNIGINVALNIYFLWLCPHAIKQWNLALPLYDPSIGVAYVFIANLVASAITVPLLSKEITDIKKGFDYSSWKAMIIYALPMLLVGLAGMVNETLDRAMIKYFYADPITAQSINGIYGASYKLSILMTLFIQAFRYAAEPFFFSHAKSSDKRTIYADVMHYFVIVCLFLFLLVMLFLDIFKLFIGPQFYEGLKVVPILLLANMFLGIYYNLSIWYKLTDKTNKGALISIIGAVITIVLNFVLIPIWGYMGCAWTTLICYFSMMLISYGMGQKYFPVQYKIKKFIVYFLLALGLFFTSEIFNSNFSFENNFVKYLISAILLSFFVITAYFFERKKIALFAQK